MEGDALIRGRSESAWDVIQHFTDRLASEYGIEASGEMVDCDELGYFVTITMRIDGHACFVDHGHRDPWWACKVAVYKAYAMVSDG